MIMGHIGFGAHFDKFIHAFHMPMFFFVTGIFFKNTCSTEQLKQKIQSRVKTLIVPYVFFAVIHYVVFFAAYGFDFQLLRLFIFNTDKEGIPIAGALWFLTASFLADTIYMIISNLFKPKHVHIIVSIIAVLGNVLALYTNLMFPFGLTAAMVGVGFIHLGHLSQRDRLTKCLNLNILSTMIILAGAFFLIFVNGYVNLRTGRYGIIPLFWLNAILAIVGGINLCRFVDRFIGERFSGLYYYVLRIGKDSIVYLCLNQLSILIAKSALNIIGAQDSIISSIVTLMISLIILALFRKMIVDTKLRIVVGR